MPQFFSASCGPEVARPKAQFQFETEMKVETDVGMNATVDLPIAVVFAMAVELANKESVEKAIVEKAMAEKIYR